MTNYNLNQYLLKYASPTLCGIKPANMFSVPAKNFVQDLLSGDFEMLRSQGFSISFINISEKLNIYFVFDLIWIRQLLAEPFTAAFLRGKGYTDVEDTQATLDELFYRIEHGKTFPHEVGIFLGYPVEDVICYEENCGRNCKYCGIWEAYSNPEEAKKCCARYRQCMKKCEEWFEEGMNIPQIIRRYKKEAALAA